MPELNQLIQRLMVFATSREADAFAEGVQHQFQNGVIYSEFEMGYRFDKDSARYSR